MLTDKRKDDILYTELRKTTTKEETKMTEKIKNLKIGHKNIRIRVGGNEFFIGSRVAGELAIEALGTDVLAWLDSHKPIHIYHSVKEVEYVYRASEKFTELCIRW